MSDFDAAVARIAAILDRAHVPIDASRKRVMRAIHASGVPYPPASVLTVVLKGRRASLFEDASPSGDVDAYDEDDELLLERLRSNHERMLRARGMLNAAIKTRRRLLTEAISRGIDFDDIVAAHPDVNVAEVQRLAEEDA